MQKEQKDTLLLKLLHKLNARERLKNLAAAISPVRTASDRELERLRAYLYAWADCQRDYHMKLGAASGSVFSLYLKGRSVNATDWLEQSDGWAMSIIDASMDDLIALPDGWRMRAALRCRLLAEGLLKNGKGMSVRVFRNGQMQSMSIEEADALADRAEDALVPIVKRKGLPL